MNAESALERYVQLCNASLEAFDNTDDLATKLYEMTLLEKNLKELLRIYPEHQSARQLEQMLPEMRHRVEAKIAETYQAPPVVQAWKRGDYDLARQQLQQIAYSMVGSSVTDEDRANFTKLMAEFANEDPLYNEVMAKVIPLLRANPGMLQSQIYQGQPDDIKEQMRYVLYFANELGHIKRIKKGSSYMLMLPENLA